MRPALAWCVWFIVGCAAQRPVPTATTKCDPAFSRFSAAPSHEARVAARREVLSCLDANDAAAAQTFRANTHVEFVKADLEDALAANDEAKLQPLFTEWANRTPTLSDLSTLKSVERLRAFPWARPWIARIVTTSMAPAKSDLTGWSHWLGGYFGKPDVDLRVATALGEQSKGRLALWQGRVLKARIDADATWMLVEEFVPTVVLRGQSVAGYYEIRNEYVEQREPRGLFFLVRIPATDERYARYDTVVVLGEVSGAREQKGKIIDQVAFQPVAEEPASVPTLDAWDVTPKGPATWSEVAR